jgi:histone H3/H4
MSKKGVVLEPSSIDFTPIGQKLMVTTPNPQPLELDADAHRLLSDASDEFTEMLLDVANSIASERGSTVIEKADLLKAASLLIEVFVQSSNASGPVQHARTAIAAALKEFIENAR